ncbi:hypothetical protein ACJX0J_006439, partial [Zea mays]
ENDVCHYVTHAGGNDDKYYGRMTATTILARNRSLPVVYSFIKQQFGYHIYTNLIFLFFFDPETIRAHICFDYLQHAQA